MSNQMRILDVEAADDLAENKDMLPRMYGSVKPCYFKRKGVFWKKLLIVLLCLFAIIGCITLLCEGTRTAFLGLF